MLNPKISKLHLLSFVIWADLTRINISNPNTWVKVVRCRSLTDTDELPLQVEIEAIGEVFGKNYTEQIKVNLDDEETYVRIELRTHSHSAPIYGGGTGTSTVGGTRPGDPVGTSVGKSNRTKGVLISTGILSIIFVIVLVLLNSNKPPNPEQPNVQAPTYVPSPTKINTQSYPTLPAQIAAPPRLR